MNGQGRGICGAVGNPSHPAPAFLPRAGRSHSTLHQTAVSPILHGGDSSRRGGFSGSRALRTSPSLILLLAAIMAFVGTTKITNTSIEKCYL